MTDDQDEDEMKVFTRELFAETDDTDEDEDGPPVNPVGDREGDNPAPEPDDDLDFVRQLFTP